MKPAFVRRRWVQVTAATLVGALVVVTTVWVTNGLRQQRLDEQEAEDATTRRAAVQEWQSTLEGELRKLGTISPGAPPALFGPLSAAIDELATGEPSGEVEEPLADAITLAKDSAKTLEGFDLTGTISDQGFDVEQTNYLLSSQEQIVHALKLYRQAALLAQMAAAADGDEQKELGERAVAIRDEAQALLTSGWTDYQQMLFLVGLGQVPTDTGTPGLGGITGPTGITGITGTTGTTSGPGGCIRAGTGWLPPRRSWCWPTPRPGVGRPGV